MTPTEALARLNECSGDLFALMNAVGLNAEQHLKGGDWRGCSFEGLDLRGLNLSHSRLHDAKFSEDTRIAGANFHGADLGFRSTLYVASDWRSAVLDDDQRQHLEEREGGGSSPVWEYVRRMKAGRSLNEAAGIYQEMLAAEVAPNAHVFATIIDKIEDDWAAVQRWRREAEGRAIRFDGALFAAMINKAPTYDFALGLFIEGKARGVFRSSYPYNALIGKTPGVDEAVSVIADMKLAGIAPDQITLNAAIKDPKRRAVPFDRAMALAREIVAGGAAIRTAEIGALIRTATSSDQKRKVTALRKRLGLPRDAHVVNAFISKADNFDVAWQIYTSDQEHGFLPDKHTFYALLGACSNLINALPVLMEMNKWKVSFDDGVIRHISRVVGDPLLVQEYYHVSIERILREYIWRYAPDRDRWIELIFASRQE